MRIVGWCSGAGALTTGEARSVANAPAPFDCYIGSGTALMPYGFGFDTFVRGSIQSQGTTPARQNMLPRAMAHCQPRYLLTSGVMKGARAPAALPPVLKMPAEAPLWRPPRSMAVAQNGPSVAPTAARASAKQPTIHSGCRVISPRP